MRNEIKSEKILVKDIFTNMWFRIPEYQYRFDEPEKVLERLENIVLMRQKNPT